MTNLPENTARNNGRHGVPDTHVWNPATGHYLAPGSDPGALLKRPAHQRPAITRSTRRAHPDHPTPAGPARSLIPADLVILPTQPPGACIICGTTTGVRKYLTGYHCGPHTPPDRPGYYGLAIPRSHTTYDPERLARHRAAPRTAALSLSPPEDSPIRGWCERCQEGWPLNSADEIGPSSATHYKVFHDDGGWRVGPKGGAVERTCAPCGGESPGGFHTVNGKQVELPPAREQFGVTFASARHDLCQNGKRQGRRVIRCDCQHRTGNQPT